MEQSSTKKGSNLVIQGSILAIASLVVRLIGFFYRVPLVRLLGDEGMGYYSNSFDIYSFALIISSYGMPAAVSKLISARMVKKKYKEAYRVFMSSLVLSTLIGIIFASILWYGAGGLAEMIGSSRSIFAIRALAPAILIFSIMAVFRGYFQGMNNMIPTALSQVVEQIFNAIFSIILASLLITKGYEFGASGGTMGTGIGALAGLIVLIVIYMISRKGFSRKMASDINNYNQVSYFSFSKIVLMTSVPIVIGTATFHMTNLIDMIMFQNALLYHGNTESYTVAMYGILTGKYKILITLPVSIASALAIATIPSVTASVVRKNKDEIKRKINMAIQFVMFISMPSFVGLFVLSKPILRMLFGIENLEIASILLKIGSISIVLFGLSTISIGILQGVDKLRVPVYSALKSLVIKIIFNIILLYVFDTHLYGAVITNIIFALASSYFNMKVIKKELQVDFNVKRIFIIPLLSSIIMGLGCLISYLLVNSVTNISILATLISIIIGVIIYAILMIMLKGIREEELKMIPGGTKLIRLFKKSKLL